MLKGYLRKKKKVFIFISDVEITFNEHGTLDAKILVIFRLII